jgi:hypothetical protein
VWDFVSGADTAIFQIFDRELGVFGRQPTIWDFRNAWIGRGFDTPGLDRILSHHGILSLPDQTARFVIGSVPTQMVPGQTYTVSVTMLNTGLTVWFPDALYGLGSQNPQDNAIWGVQRVAVPGPVVPGQPVSFSFDVSAPSTPGTYHFQWRMVQDGVEWFGDFTPDVVITVSKIPARCFDPQLKKWVLCDGGL